MCLSVSVDHSDAHSHGSVERDRSLTRVHRALLDRHRRWAVTEGLDSQRGGNRIRELQRIAAIERDRRFQLGRCRNARRRPGEGCPGNLAPVSISDPYLENAGWFSIRRLGSAMRFRSTAGVKGPAPHSVRHSPSARRAARSDGGRRQITPTSRATTSTPAPTPQPAHFMGYRRAATDGTEPRTEPGSSSRFVTVLGGRVPSVWHIGSGIGAGAFCLVRRECRSSPTDSAPDSVPPRDFAERHLLHFDFPGSLGLRQSIHGVEYRRGS